MKPIKIGNSFYLNVPNKIVKDLDMNKDFVCKKNQGYIAYSYNKDKIEYIKRIAQSLNISCEEAEASIDRYRRFLCSDDFEVSRENARELCHWLNTCDAYWDHKYSAFKAHLCGEIIDHDNYDELVKITSQILNEDKEDREKQISLT